MTTSLIDTSDIQKDNLSDFDTPLHVVKGFEGDDLTKLQQNLKTKKLIGVGEKMQDLKDRLKPFFIFVILYEIVAIILGYPILIIADKIHMHKYYKNYKTSTNAYKIFFFNVEYNFVCFMCHNY